MVKFINKFKKDLSVQVLMNKDNSKFFIDLHRELLSIFNKRNEFQLKETYELQYELDIRSKLGDNLCCRLEDLKDDFFNKVIEKLDLDTFTQDITERNHYPSIDSYAIAILESIYALYKKLFHRLALMKAINDNSHQELMNKYGNKKMITYNYLFPEKGEKYLNPILIDLQQVYINSIRFTDRFVVDEMKYFSCLTLHRKEKLFELLKKKNKISLKRRKNLCESEISSICLWKELMKEEYPTCLDPVEDLIREELTKINESIKDRDNKDIFFRPSDDEFRATDSNEMKKCYKQLVGIYFDCSFGNFCNVIFKEKGRIDWKGKNNELLYFSSLFSDAGIVKDNYRFLYRFFTINGEEIIEDNNNKNTVSLLRKKDSVLKRKENLKNAFSHMFD